MHIEVGYQTVGYKDKSGHWRGGNKMSLEVNGTLMAREEVPIVEADDRTYICGTCKGTNGGCALYAPYFENIKRSMPYLYVVDVKMDMAWAIMYAAKSDNVIKQNYMRMGYTDMITDKFIWNMVNSIRKQTGLFVLGAGHCHGCMRKIDCTVLKGEPCCKPNVRRYSMEATGVECSELSHLLYTERLSWWYKSPNIPAVMRRFAGVFTDKDLDFALLDAVRAHNHVIPLNQTAVMYKYPMDLIDRPPHAYDTDQYLAYTAFDPV